MRSREASARVATRATAYLSVLFGVIAILGQAAVFWWMGWQYSRTHETPIDEFGTWEVMSVLSVLGLVLSIVSLVVNLVVKRAWDREALEWAEVGFVLGLLGIPAAVFVLFVIIVAHT